MDQSTIREHLLTGSKKLTDTGIVSARSLSVSFRHKDKMFFVPVTPEQDGSGAIGVMDIARFSYDGNDPAGFENQLHCAIFKHRRDLNVLIHSDQVNILTSCRAGGTIPPLLDDFAQLVGVSVNVVDDQSLPGDKAISKILHALKRRNAVLLSNRFAICGGKDFDDALATAQVLEKGCKADIETKCLGGAVRINKIEAYLMRWVYLFKYSKLK